jgi:alpha-galactosidase
VIKVAMIGAGSVVFSRNLTGDILSYPEFRSATFSYMDIDKQRLDVGAALCRKVARGLGASPTIQATLDRREALRGADFVINMVQIGGFDSTLVDFEIPRKYGLNFTIADTTGPGGLFRALRTYPMLSGLCRDMTELSPKALLLNYSNPMSMNMQTVSRTSDVRAVGLCHSVQGTFDQLMRYIDQRPQDVTFLCAGINHMAFYLRIEKDGQDLYPRLFEAMNDPEIYQTNKVRFELMKRLGHFVTESSEHSAEYSPYFIPHGPEQMARFDVPIDEYLRRCDGIVDEFERMQRLSSSDEAMEHHRSHEYGSTIIHSMVSGSPSVVYGNMPNRGAIANLPDTAIAEVPTLVDRGGPQFTTVGELPPQLVAYMTPHIQQHELFIRAAMEGRRDYVYQAAMFDPLTAATLSLDQIVDMCDELIAAHGMAQDGGVLPNLDAKRTLVSRHGGSGKTFAPPTARQLRESWDAAQAQAAAAYIRDWHVIGPFAPKSPKTLSLETTTPLEAQMLQSGPRLDAPVEHDGAVLRWSKASAGQKDGFVNLTKALGDREYCFGYGYARIESIHARDAVLHCGSDDAIRIWLNGKPVHSADRHRAYQPNCDAVPVHLVAGINHILVKIVNYRAGWGFGVAIPAATF